MLPTWDDSFSVHNAKIDAQHKKLFELAGHAYICANRKISRSEIRELMSAFLNYMKEHFQDEENYMESIQYPHLKRHKELHRTMVHDFSAMINTTTNTNELKEKLSIVAKNWLLQHILKEDIQIERFRAFQAKQQIKLHQEQQREEHKTQQNMREESLKCIKEAQEITHSQSIHEFLQEEVLRSTSKTHTNQEQYMPYTCQCADKIHQISLAIHQKIESGKVQFRCKNCGHLIEYQDICIL